MPLFGAAAFRQRLLLETRQHLLEALIGVALAGVVRLVVEAHARHLLLERGEALIFGLGHLGQVVGAFGDLAVERRQRPPAIDDVGELRLHFGLRRFGLKERDALERAVPIKPLEQLAVRAMRSFAIRPSRAIDGSSVMVLAMAESSAASGLSRTSTLATSSAKWSSSQG